METTVGGRASNSSSESVNEGTSSRFADEAFDSNTFGALARTSSAGKGGAATVGREMFLGSGGIGSSELIDGVLGGGLFPVFAGGALIGILSLKLTKYPLSPTKAREESPDEGGVLL